MNIPIITPHELARLYGNGVAIDLVDVRTPMEYQELHVEFARNVPLGDLDAAALMSARNGSSQEPLYVICRSGSRGRQACEKFIKAGYANVINVEGGTLACAESGLPVRRGRKAISLDRQTCMAVGLLVILGAALAWWLHPAWVLLCGFVGAGMTYAGLTDTCFLGMLLARMPWNRGQPAEICKGG